MSREWKPGDVAMLTVRDEEVQGFVDNHDCWCLTGHSFFKGIRVGNDVLVQDARPLVVIDPEDREQIEHLSDLLVAQNVSLHGCLDATSTNGGVQRALRSLVTPPRPAEPTTWGVVEASCVHSDRRLEWVLHPDGNWWPFAPYGDADDRRPMPDDWDSLIDPVVVRAGVGS